MEWLKGNENLYWLIGKPGSGKSTLMKYLYNDPRTIKYLEHWSRNYSLINAAYVFYNSGTTMKISRMGFIQTLLHQAMNEGLDRIPKAFPDRWRSHQIFEEDFNPLTCVQVPRTLRNLVSNAETRFFFFIDGLDEFDGNCSELADLLLRLSSRENVKICTASRPWLVFEENFEGQPRLRLEDLTQRGHAVICFGKSSRKFTFPGSRRSQTTTM